MLQSNQLKLLALASIALAFFLLLIQLKLGKTKGVYSINHKANKKSLLTPLYQLFTRLPILNHYSKNIEQRLLITTAADKTDVQIAVVKIILIALLALSLLFSIFAYFIKTWYLWLVLILIAYFVIETVVDMLIEKIKLNLLEQMITFIDYLRNAFLERQTIDEAYLDATDKLSEKYNYVKKQALAVHRVLVSANGEIELENYYQIAPNAYFKILAGLSYIVREHGDTELENGSAFIKSLSHLSAEIKEDILRKKQLALGLSSMNIIAIMPILMMQPLKNWASNSFYPLKTFYESAFGFMIEMLLLVIILLAFIFLRRLQTESVFDGVEKEQSTLSNFFYKRLKPLARLLLPAEDSEAYQKLKRKQQKAHIFKPLTYHYFKKIVSTVLCLCFIIIVFLLMRNISLKAVYENPSSSDSFFAGKLNPSAYENAMALTAFDNKILAVKTRWQADELSNYLESELGLSGAEKRLTLERIFKKQELIASTNLSVVKIIIMYILLLFAWFLPDLQLTLRQKLLKIDIDLEITRFQLVVTMLMHVETMTVDQLLNWLEIFSQLFKRPLQKAIMDYDAGAVNSLKQLKSASEKVAYQTIINHLINSVESLTIAEAFSEFEIEKQYYQDKRKLINSHIVKKKIFWGKVLGFVPIYALMIIYFMLPLIYASIGELEFYFEKLSM